MPSHSLKGCTEGSLELGLQGSSPACEYSGGVDVEEGLRRGREEKESEELDGHDFLAIVAGRKGLRSFLKEGLTGCGLGDLSQLLCHLFDVERGKCGFKHSKIKRSGGIFPLPETLAGLKSCGSDLRPNVAWLLLCINRSLNSFYGVEWSEAVEVTKAKQASVKSLAAYADEVSQWSEKFEGVRWESLMGTRTVDYNGDEVRVARFFRWENLEGALPEEVGKIRLEDVCELGTLDYILNFEKYLLPTEAQVYTRPPRVMVAEDSWEQVCSGLVAQGICDFMPIKDIFQVDGKPLLNGLFGVSKDEFKNGWEVYRLIMNLVPVNKLCRNLGGDISTLPTWAGMAPLFA